MKYIVTTCNNKQLEELLQSKLDGFIIGDAKTSLRLPFTYDTIEELKNAIHKIVAADKEVYIDMHTMITNDLLPHIELLFNALKDEPVTGIIFADPAIYMIAKKTATNIPLVLSTETMTTNWYGVNYWADKGVKHVALAKELTKKAIRSISKNNLETNVKLEIQAFGPLAMFHSRRTLLNNYYKHLQEQGNKLTIHETTYLHDEERQNFYQIFEDLSGTHIMSPKDICLIDELKFIHNTPNLEYLKLDSLGHTEEQMNEIFKLFIEARSVFDGSPELYDEKKQEYLQKVEALYDTSFRGIDKGFLNKPTIY